MADPLVVGIAGTGRMGSRIAQKLLDANLAVHVWNLEPEPVRELAARGAQPAATPAELGAAVDVALAVLENDEAVRQVVLERGLLEAMHAGSVFADLSTVAPELEVEIANAAESLDEVEALDVQMSGSLAAVEAGELVMFAGGKEEALGRIRPVLEPISKTIVYMGAHGNGARMKLAVNTILGVSMQAIAESVAFGVAVGLDRNQLLDALSQTAAIAPAHRGKLENIRNDDYTPAFALRLMRKDFAEILAGAEHAGLELPATAASAEVCAEELALADGDEDFSAVARRMRQRIGAARAG